MNIRQMLLASFNNLDEKANAEKLQKAGYPDSLNAVDNSEHVPASVIYCGVTFFEKYKESKEQSMDDLDSACDCGLYHALYKRTILASDVIINDASTDSERSSAMESVQNDLAELGRLYWSVGYAHASRIMLKIGDYFDKKDKALIGSARGMSREQTLSIMEAGFGNEAIIIYEEAARHFYRSRILQIKPESERLIKIIYKEQGIQACGWDSYEAGERDVLAHIPEERRQEILAGVQAEINQMTNSRPGIKKA